MRTGGVGLVLVFVVGCARPAPEAPPPPLVVPTDEAPPEPAPAPVTIVEPTTPAEIPPPPPGPAPLLAVAPACGFPTGLPATRSAGGLTVPAVPGKRRYEFTGRLRSHTDGALSARSQRVWVGTPVPTFVPLASGTQELMLLDPTPNGYFAVYRDPYDASSCKLSGSKNCDNEVAAFDCSGKTLFRVPLKTFFSRKDHLELQDARFAGDVVYFNEACQSYSSGAGGKCSSLVALDPYARKVLWRSPALTSNNRFKVYDKYIVTGYGFTAEPDFLFVIRRSDGKVMQKVGVPSAHEDLIEGPGSIVAQMETGRGLLFTLEGFDGPSPKLVLQGMSERMPR
ncbi:MAG: hypothetical protein HYZ29_02300 [Myxococcales bacterium]|nr:hypothetical protein [Myxococcales bacterium]